MAAGMDEWAAPLIKQNHGFHDWLYSQYSGILCQRYPCFQLPRATQRVFSKGCLIFFCSLQQSSLQI